MTGFWILGAAALASSTALVFAVLGVPAPAGWGAAAGTAVLLPGLFWRPWFETGVKAWNKSVRVIAPALRTYVLLARSGSSLDARFREGESKWSPKAARLPSTVADQAFPVLEPLHRGLYVWARSTRSEWMILLVPMVFLLNLLTEEAQDSAPPSSTYTLY
jgi:hypothetical protein